jgi:hypothetical protein
MHLNTPDVASREQTELAQHPPLFIWHRSMNVKSKKNAFFPGMLASIDMDYTCADKFMATTSVDESRLAATFHNIRSFRMRANSIYTASTIVNQTTIYYESIRHVQLYYSLYTQARPWLARKIIPMHLVKDEDPTFT